MRFILTRYTDHMLGGDNPTERKAIHNLIDEERLKEKIAKRKKCKNEIMMVERWLAVLNKTEKYVIEGRYIRRMPWFKIAKALGISTRRARAVKYRAMDKIGRIICG